jgi:predicted DNA-binding helix-hairpin-helix protein
MYLANTPIEINKAEKQELIRIPGIGLKGADAILNARRLNKLRDLSTLKKLGIIAERAAPYILFDGRKAAQQLVLI